MTVTPAGDSDLRPALPPALRQAGPFDISTRRVDFRRVVGAKSFVGQGAASHSTAMSVKVRQKRVVSMIIEPKTTDVSIVSIREGLGRRTYPAGSTIFAEGETGTIAYILLRGDVTIFVRFGTDQERALTELKPGQMFGVHALMAGAQRAGSAYTRNGCELLAVSESRLKQKLEEADPFLRYWVDYLSKRIIDLST